MFYFPIVLSTSRLRGVSWEIRAATLHRLILWKMMPCFNLVSLCWIRINLCSHTSLWLRLDVKQMTPVRQYTHCILPEQLK